MSNSNVVINGLGPDGNEWDDTELIKAYDRAVKGWRKSNKADENKKDAGEGSAGLNVTPGPGPWVSVPKPESSLEAAIRRQEESVLVVGNWMVGSPCRAVYTQDGLEYEAKIIGLEGPKCNIRFVGYGNEEKKLVVDLKDTFGKRSRDRQRREAQLFNYSLNPELNLEEYYSSVSLTSSMYNNCPESVLRVGDREDDQQTTTTECSQGGGQLSVVKSHHHKKSRNTKSPSKRKRDGEDEILVLPLDDLVDGGDEVDQIPTRLNVDSAAEEIIPSGAEATMGSSSSSDISVGEDGDDEATSGPGVIRGHGATPNSSKGFPGMVPRFPIPPMPMSLAGEDGKFDFGRGHLPSLLLSWYMSGYHAGYFDARQELASAGAVGGNSSKSSKSTKDYKEETKSRSKRL